jgi:MFS superfamily sulfate permease-like transporter
MYAVFGSVPQMIVGPESAISLVVGEAVGPLIAHDDTLDPVDLVSVMSCIGGFYLLGAGLCRFGFLDNVLSRALLRGFISAVGLLMNINSLFEELGLRVTIEDIPQHFHSPYAKFKYLLTHLKYAHTPTALISLIAFITMYGTGKLKKTLISKGYSNFVFLPEILIVVVVCTILCGVLDWQSLGVEIVGKIRTSNFTYNNPFTSEMLPLYHSVMSSSFLAATLGFFESTTASKSLGSSYDLPISSNRELVALGAINIFGGMIGALPAFGGYGRSRINAMSGATTTCSGLVMGCVTLLTIFCLLDYIYYLPRCILSVVTTIVGLKLLEEAPPDLRFHWRARGYSEIITFCITVLVSLFYSIEAGVTVGVGYSIIRVIKNSSNSRIQILGRLPGTNTFMNADEPLPDEDGDLLEEIEGCLIVKIAEPLTFSNTTDLKMRLMRLERYGSTKMHPAAPRLRNEFMNKHVLFDMAGMTFFDSSAAQIFYEILEAYRSRNIRFYFIRVPTKYGIRERLDNSGITKLYGNRYYGHIDEVLKIIDAGSDCSPVLSTYSHPDSTGSIV